MNGSVHCHICSELYRKIESVQKELGIPFIDASRIVSSETHISIDVSTRRPVREIVG